jgi:hypothetical protein
LAALPLTSTSSELSKAVLSCVLAVALSAWIPTGTSEVIFCTPGALVAGFLLMRVSG